MHGLLVEGDVLKITTKLTSQIKQQELTTPFLIEGYNLLRKLAHINSLLPKASSAKKAPDLSAEAAIALKNLCTDLTIQPLLIVQRLSHYFKYKSAGALIKKFFARQDVVSILNSTLQDDNLALEILLINKASLLPKETLKELSHGSHQNINADLKASAIEVALYTLLEDCTIDNQWRKQAEDLKYIFNIAQGSLATEEIKKIADIANIMLKKISGARGFASSSDSKLAQFAIDILLDATPEEKKEEPTQALEKVQFAAACSSDDVAITPKEAEAVVEDPKEPQIEGPLDLQSLIDQCDPESLGRVIHYYYSAQKQKSLENSQKKSLVMPMKQSARWKLSEGREVSSADDGVIKVDEHKYAMLSITIDSDHERFETALKKGFAGSAFGRNGIKVIYGEGTHKHERIGYELKINSDKRAYTNKVYKSGEEELFIFDQVGNHTDTNSLSI